MTPQSLPPRPNLEHLKNQAKALLRAAHARDGDALTRFAALPALKNTPLTEIVPADLALHDAQSVIAREYGFSSWNELREEVEAQTLSVDAAVDEFVRSATGGAFGRASRLLALHPGIARANLFTALVLGDVDVVRTRLGGDRGLVRLAGGPQNWEPLLYVCHTCMANEDAARKEALVEIARTLCALGADPNG